MAIAALAAPPCVGKVLGVTDGDTLTLLVVQRQVNSYI